MQHACVRACTCHGLTTMLAVSCQPCVHRPQARFALPNLVPPQSLPFLKLHASSATIMTLVDAATSGGDLMTAGVTYLKTSLIPKIGANVFFFALALLFLVVFLLG